MHLRDPRGPALLAGLFLTLLTACVVPVLSAPGLSGSVVDRTTGEPVAGALVVVRFDGRYDDQLPDRDLIGHAETLSAEDGSFRIERYSRGGVSVWPLYRTEARVVAVLSAGYRCPDPQHVTGKDDVRVTLEPALDLEDQQGSCRPVASRRGETESYHTAWRKLYPEPTSPQEREEQRQLSRALEARSALGFGHNCEGPVVDLALAPEGDRVAFAVASGDGVDVQVARVTPEGTRAARSAGVVANVPPRRLAWSRPGELVLWAPASLERRSAAASIFAGGESQVVWSNAPALPASMDYAGQAARAKTPLEPESLSDEADTRWLGRTFDLEHSIDLASGLPRDRMLVRREDGSRYALELPGEACGGARFGRPQYRIGVGGRLGFDLRFVDGGCRAVAIDLATGAWSSIDGSREPAECRVQRNLPPAQLSTALRGWTRELHEGMHRQGIDTGAAYALRIAENGRTEVLGRSAEGAALRGDAPRFPLATPLRRIDVTHVAPHGGGMRAAPDAAPAQLAPL